MSHLAAVFVSPVPSLKIICAVGIFFHPYIYTYEMSYLMQAITKKGCLSCFFKLEEEPALVLLIADDLEPGPGRQAQIVGQTQAAFYEFNSISGVDLFLGEPDVQRIDDVELLGLALLREDHVPDEQPPSRNQDPGYFLENLPMVGRRDVHESKKDRRGREGAVQEF